MKVIIIFVLFAIGFSVAEINLHQLPIPNIDDLAVIKERCETKGGEGTYEKIKDAKARLETCLKGMFNVTQINLELEEKAKTGSMDEVFGKYCNKRSEVKVCITSFTDAIKLCLEEHESEALTLTSNVVEQLVDFLCHRDGDRLAMFVAEGGIDCLNSRSEAVQNCVNTTFKIQEASIPSDLNSLPILIDREKCNKLGDLQECVVKELEKCEESTPSNIIDALFKFIKKHACKDVRKKRSISKRSVISEVTNTLNAAWIKTRFVEYMKQRCRVYGTSNSFSNFEASYTQSRACMQKLQKEGSLTTGDYKEKIRNCLNDKQKHMDECIPDSEKYIPEFYVNIMSSIVDFVAKHRETLQNQENKIANCVQIYKEDENKTKNVRGCINKIFDNSDANFEKVVTKENICISMEEAKSCINDSVKTVCEQDTEVISLIENFLKAVVSPCY